MGLLYALKQQGPAQSLGGPSVGDRVGPPQSLNHPVNSSLGMEMAIPEVDMAQLSEEMAVPAYLEAEREATELRVVRDGEGGRVRTRQDQVGRGHAPAQRNDLYLRKGCQHHLETWNFAISPGKI